MRGSFPGSSGRSIDTGVRHSRASRHVGREVCRRTSPGGRPFPRPGGRACAVDWPRGRRSGVSWVRAGSICRRRFLERRAARRAPPTRPLGVGLRLSEETVSGRGAAGGEYCGWPRRRRRGCAGARRAEKQGGAARARSVGCGRGESPRASRACPERRARLASRDVGRLVGVVDRGPHGDRPDAPCAAGRSPGPLDAAPPALCAGDEGDSAALQARPAASIRRPPACRSSFNSRSFSRSTSSFATSRRRSSQGSTSRSRTSAGWGSFRTSPPRPARTGPATCCLRSTPRARPRRLCSPRLRSTRASASCSLRSHSSS
jgi:hypothetical protein